MPNLMDPFFFDLNFNFGEDGVFSAFDTIEMAPLPPILGFFLLLDGTNFLLLDGENLTLL